MFIQFSPGAPAIAPDLRHGQSTGGSMVCLAPGENLVEGQSGLGPGTRGEEANSPIPPGRPRRPRRRALSMYFQFSPGAPGIAPDSQPGHRPVAAWCASPQARIWSRVNQVGAGKRAAQEARQG